MPGDAGHGIRRVACHRWYAGQVCRADAGHAGGMPAGYPGMPGAGGMPAGYPGMPGAGGMPAGYPGMPGVGGMPGSGAAPGSQPGVEPAKVERETFMVKAEHAMQQGNEKLAFDYMYASALAEDSTDVLDKFMWVNAFKRPAVAVRWGIGVDLTVSPKSYEGNYYPVGSSQTIPETHESPIATGGGQQRGGAGGRPSGWPRRPDAWRPA